MRTEKKPVVLIILDGWGMAVEKRGNAVFLANTPNFDKYFKVYPKTTLSASGEDVGLPHGEPGNSEAGHLNLGAGKIVFQEQPAIDMAIASGFFAENKAFLKAIEHSKKNNSNLHLMGLISTGSVHSNFGHLLALLHLAKTKNLPQVYLHLFTDGRDSAPHSSIQVIGELEKEMENIGIGKISTISGRYFAMDRDYRWERIEKAYKAITSFSEKKFTSALLGITASHNQEITDEFIEPFNIVNGETTLIKDNDAVIFFNYRIDRPRELTKAFVLPDFENFVPKKSAFDPYAEKYGLKQYTLPKEQKTFKREKILKNLFFATMTEYEPGLPVEVAFYPGKVSLPLARILSEKDLRQLHIAETEKERHVTYYFNGRREKPFPGEDWLEIPSPKIAKYDTQPEMSAYGLTEQVLKKLKLQVYDFVLINFANPDIVAHTGNLEASIKACEAVDDCLGQIAQTVLNLGGICFITADHGNAEELIDLKTGEIDTQHSSYPVPFIAISNQFRSSPAILAKGV
ncbi:MAG: 2,3-bisphosphoglycerate-independent phosphoglycerate mutase, partial [Patescibacteria group bacterium]